MLKRKKNIYFVLFSLCIISIYFVISRRWNEISPYDADDSYTGRSPVILVWVEPYHHSSWKLPTHELCGGGCHLTNNRQMLNVSDAVIFYMKGVEYDRSLLPPKRERNQLYTWWCHESPFVTRNYYEHTLEYPANYFNYTMTYNANSHVAAAMIPISAQDWFLHRIGRGDEAHEQQLKSFTDEEEFEKMFAELLKMKTKVVNPTSWIASDCSDVKGAVDRHNFVKTLQSVGGLRLDTFGRCGELQLSKEHTAMYSTLQSYKFYLAFENARNCSGYITEKLWYNSLYAGVVPVVDGSSRGEYERVAPPNSFIHVDDFDRDPVKITDYLTKLASNDEMYKEYFKWWMMPGFYPIFNLREPQDEDIKIQNSEEDYEVGGFCHLCRMLNRRWNSTSATYHAVENLADFYYKPETSLCIDQS